MKLNKKREGQRASQICFSMVILMIITLLTGCSSLVDELASDFSNNSTKEIGYESLASLIKNPDTLTYSSYLHEPASFYGLVSSEPEIFEFEEDDPWNGDELIMVRIAREPEKFLYLNISKLEETPVLNEVYKFTAVLEGSLYYVEDNKRIDILSGEATAMEAYDVPEFEEPADKVFPVSNGTIEFVDFEIVDKNSILGKSLIVYYNFTNTESKEAYPSLSAINLWQEESGYLHMGAALMVTPTRSDAVGSTVSTPPGKTMLYYTAPTGFNMEYPLEFTQYNDDFSVVNAISLDISQLENTETE